MNGHIIIMPMSLVNVLLFIVTFICYHYAKHRSKQKKYWHTNNSKIWKTTEFKKVDTKTCKCCF